MLMRILVTRGDPVRVLSTFHSINIHPFRSLLVFRFNLFIVHHYYDLDMLIEYRYPK